MSERTHILSRIESELLLLCRSEKKKLYEQYSNLCCGCCCPNHDTTTTTTLAGGERRRKSGSWFVSSTATNVTGGGATTTSNNSSSSSASSTKRNLLSWQLCCDCWRGGVDGTQERLTNLYNQLEEYNQAIGQEQRRRRRVMKVLDRMESVEGVKDIDYVLSSPFVQNNTNAQSETTTTNGASVGEPSNPPGTAAVSQAGTEVNPPASIPEEGEPQKQQQQQLSTDKPTDYMLLSTDATPGSSALRSRSPSTHVGGKTGRSKAQAGGSAMKIQQQQPSDVGKKNAMPTAPPFLKAKHAIRRYSRVNREVSFLGRPIRSPNSFGASDNPNYNNPAGGANSTTWKYSNNASTYAAAPGGVVNPFLAFSEPMEQHLNEVTDKAFVVMRTYTAATIAIQSMHSSKPGSMQVTTAPEPRDILWENIYVSKGAQRTRSLIGEFAVKMLVCFYIIPIATVALLVSESALVSSSPRLAQLDQASAIFSVAIAIVQPICIVGLQQLLPPLFVAIGQAEGRTSFSEVQMQAFSRYFLFQVLNVFLVTTIAGTIFDTVALIIEKPESAFEMLGNSLPRMSSFFITFVIMKTFLGLGAEMVRIVALVQGILRFMIFPHATLRMKRQVLLGLRPMDDPGWFPFHKILAQDMLVVVISVVFAVVAPLVLLPCALFCLLSRVMWTHQHLYVYESVFESGGQFWPKIFRRFVFGLIIAQMTITGQFILKEARHEAYATMALMFMTYFFLRSTRARYDPTSSTLPLEVATVMDITLQQEEEARNLKRQQQSPGEFDDKRQAQIPRQPGEEGFDPVSPPRSVANYHQSSTMGGDCNDEDNDDDDSDEPGRFIGGQYDPFRKAYVQPALRANPKARPEQPFPPAQLGREEAFFNTTGDHQNNVDTSNSVDLDGNGLHHDSAASVRVRSLNQQERRLINRWWNDQLQRAGPQNTFMVLIGEECGTLTLSPHNHHHHPHNGNNAASSNIMLNETHSFV